MLRKSTYYNPKRTFLTLELTILERIQYENDTSNMIVLSVFLILADMETPWIW